jgi:ElaA protein
MSTRLDLQWTACSFDELGVRLLHDILRLRVDVFVVEQNCAYPELDGLDLDAWHVTGRLPDGTVAAYARILPPGHDGLPHVGRVVVAQPFRRQGLGRQLMEQVLMVLRNRYDGIASALAAQAHLVAFYQGFGYAPIGPEYLLDGILHVDMVLAPKG